MRSLLKSNVFSFTASAILLLTLSSCLTARRLDKYVASQYNNELPRPGKKKNPLIDVSPASSANNGAISTTVHKTDKLLPLIIYWKYNHRQRCSLNPSIPVTNFSNTINSVATKKLSDKLNGRKLDLTVDQAPAEFSIIVKENMIWVVYAFAWAKVYVEPDVKNLVVSYKLIETDNTSKTGTITVKNEDKNRGVRFFQSWTSATSEYLSAYNANLTSMTKAFVSQLMEEL